MKHPILLVALTCLFIHATPAAAAIADEPIKSDDHPRPVCLNLYCLYQPEGSTSGTPTCSAAATFVKQVTAAGDEVPDISHDASETRFEVECDQRRLYNSSAHRYTDHMGTRIQAQTGPYPAILLPKSALTDGRRYQSSKLELGGYETLSGYCFVYTGPQ